MRIKRFGYKTKKFLAVLNALGYSRSYEVGYLNDKLYRKQESKHHILP